MGNVKSFPLIACILIVIKYLSEFWGRFKTSSSPSCSHAAVKMELRCVTKIPAANSEVLPPFQKSQKQLLPPGIVIRVHSVKEYPETSMSESGDSAVIYHSSRKSITVKNPFCEYNPDRLSAINRVDTKACKFVCGSYVS